jgi:Protein of unknown function (DUF3106)
MKGAQAWTSPARGCVPVAAALLLGLCAPGAALRAQPVDGAPPGVVDAAPGVADADSASVDGARVPPYIDTVPVAADAGQPGIAWSSLSLPQQQLLWPMRQRWDSLSPARQRALARAAESWLSLTPEQRAEARARFARLRKWQRLEQPQRPPARLWPARTQPGLRTRTRVPWPPTAHAAGLVVTARRI